MKPRRPCIEATCPQLTPPGGTRCPTHEQERQRGRNEHRGWYRDPAYRAARGEVRDDPTLVCWICHRPATDNDDPMTVDHLLPAHIHGGAGPLLPAHRSCNSRRGADERWSKQQDTT